jgi:hypothetical protein
MRSYVKFLVSSLLISAVASPVISSAQSKVFYLENVDGTNSTLYRTVYPKSSATSLITGTFTSIAADPATTSPYVAESGSISLRVGLGLQPILQFANVTDGFTIDGGSRNFVFIGGSSIRTLYTMGFIKKSNGQYPDPKALVSFSDTVTPRQVATLDSQQVYWSQGDANGTSSIYQIGINGGTPLLIHSQTDGNEGGRTITAIAVDSLHSVLYFCQKGSTSVIKALTLGSATATTLLTYDGECNSLAVDSRAGNLYVAGTPNNSGPGLVAYKISEPTTFTRFANGKIVRSVSVAGTTLVTKVIVPVAPIVSTVGSSATIYFERFKGAGVNFKLDAVLTYPNGKKKTLDPDRDSVTYKSLPSGTYSVKYRMVVFGSGKKRTSSSYSKATTFKIQ